MTTQANVPVGSQQAPAGNQTQADPLFEKRVLELQRRENELRKAQAAMKDHVSWDQLKEMSKKDRKGLFEKLGIDAASPLEDPSDPLVDLRNQVKSLMSQKEAEEKARQTEEFRKTVRDQLSANSEKYELIELLGAHDQLFDYLESNKNEDGSLLDPLPVADLLEENLYKRLESVKPAKKLAPWFDKSASSQNPFSPPKTDHPLDTKHTLTSTDHSSSSKPKEALLDKTQALQHAASFLKYTNP
jgi:hypothetical protein